MKNESTKTTVMLKALDLQLKAILLKDLENFKAAQKNAALNINHSIAA
jgi:hypothetical protein